MTKKKGPETKRRYTHIKNIIMYIYIIVRGTLIEPKKQQGL